jgi:PAS domain S-box-containing protein
MTHNTLKGKGISRRLLWRVILLSLFLALLSSSVQAWISYQEGLSSIQETIEQIKKTQAGSITKALWDFNREQLVTQLEGLLNFPFIKHVSVIADGIPYSEAGLKIEKGVSSWEIQLVQSTNRGPVTLGSLRILVDIASIRQAVVKNIAWNLLFMTMMVAIMAVVLFLLFNGMVTRHLTTVGMYFSNADSWRIGQRLVLNKRHRNDELDTIVDAYNQMSGEREKAYRDMCIAQEEKNASEERYRRIVETSQEGIWALDKDFVTTYVNNRMADMLGYTQEEMLGKNFSDFIAPDQLSDHEQTVASRKLGQNQVYERCFRKQDGGELWTLASPHGMFDKQGQFAGSFAMFTDITERKRAEELLRESEARIRRITDSTLDAIMMMDPDGLVSFWNPAAERILGYMRDEAIGQDLHMLIVPERYHEAYRAGLPRFRLTGQGDAIGKTQDMVARRKDGQEITLSLSLSALNIKGGWHAVGILRDITERKQAEEQLRQNSEKFLRIFEMAPECFLFVRLRDSVIIIANAAFETITGHTRKEALDHSALELDLWDDPPVRGEFLEQLEAQGQVKDFEFLLRRKDGVLRRAVISAQLVTLAEEQCYVSIIHDITDERKTQELLIQSEKMVSLGSLAAGIAHEINNPLGIVHQAVQNLILRTSPDQKKNLETAANLGLDMGLLQQYLHERKLDVFLRDIQVAAMRASGIVRNMLNFSRRSESKRQICDLRHIIEQSVFLASSDYDLKKSFDFKSIKIVLDLDENLPPCSCTETEIEQVILNLLRNSAQAMSMARPPTRNPEIDIRLRAGESCVRIEVADNGPGIAPNVQRKVFEPFFTTKPPGVGTGLGLSVSYFIITKGHGGKMWMTSEPGKGTTFFIELPAEQPEADHA